MTDAYKVLIVDDEDDVRQTLAGIFADRGYLVTAAESGEEALDNLGNEYYHFIVVDIRLEGDEDDDDSGVKLAEEIRNENIDSQIIFITGKAVKGQHLMFAKEYNVLSYIEKGEAGDWVEDVYDTVEIFSSSEIMAAQRDREKAQIFLSYAREDQEAVEEIYQKLFAAGLKPWMDTKDILVGEDWELAIENAVHNSHFFMACLSPNSVGKRGFLQKEFSIALDIKEEKLKDDIYLLPVRLDICKVPDQFKSIQWVDLFNDSAWVRLLKAIQEGIRRLDII